MGRGPLILIRPSDFRAAGECFAGFSVLLLKVAPSWNDSHFAHERSPFVSHREVFAAVVPGWR